MKAYRIVNWERFEKSDHKKCNSMTWVATPTSHDGIGFLTLMNFPEGLRKYGGWHLILQTAAKCPTRGLLVADSGRVIDAAYIALKTRTNESDIKDAIEACCKIGWLEHVSISGDPPENSGDPPENSCLQDKTEQDRTVQDKTEQKDNAPSGAEADCVGPEFSTRDGAWRMSAGFRQTLADTFPDAPLEVEIVKAATWTHTAKKPKTARGMHQFLLNWFARNYAKPSARREGPSQEALAAADEVEARIRRGELQ